MAASIASVAVSAIAAATPTASTIASAASAAAIASTSASSIAATSTAASIASVTVSSKAATSSAATETTSTATTTTTSGTVNFDFLTINNGSIKFFHGSIRTVVISHGYEGIPLLGDVYIGDLTASGKFAFQDIPGTPSVHSIYKKLSHFVCFFVKIKTSRITSRKDETTDAG